MKLKHLKPADRSESIWGTITHRAVDGFCITSHRVYGRCLVRGQHSYGTVAVKEADEKADRIRAVDAYLESVGAKRTSEEVFHSFDLETKAGPLKISVYLSWVAMRFDDVERAKQILGWPHALRSPFGLNQYSGKWNFHPGGDWGVEDLKRHLSRVL